MRSFEGKGISRVATRGMWEEVWQKCFCGVEKKHYYNYSSITNICGMSKQIDRVQHTNNEEVKQAHAKCTHIYAGIADSAAAAYLA